MALNDVASADRVHIAFLGMRNAGKSSVVNAVTSQELSIVSDVKGTTTDVVSKAMELLPLGPVVILDTPGLDDEGELGEKRVQKAKRALNLADIAVLVIDASVGVTPGDEKLFAIVKAKGIPCIKVFNKSDLIEGVKEAGEDEIYVSAKLGAGIEDLKNRIAALRPSGPSGRIVGDMVSGKDVVVLVTPIDSAAPKGRLILPQQQTIRDLLDSGAAVVVCRDTELEETLSKLRDKPKLVITDSQAFGAVSRIVPRDVPMTSFSILFARYKGTLAGAVRGAAALDRLKDGDSVLISEGCTHHRQCGDIGSVKLPMWIKKYTGKEIEFEFTSGKDFPEELGKYALVIHCGGCMLTEREMHYRAASAHDAGVPFSNYGIVIAHTHGILRRAVEPFADVREILG